VRAERAKVAVSAVFLLNGFAFASWVSRVPALRDTLDLTPGGVGLLLLSLSAGTLLALPLSGAIVSRLGSGRTVLAGAAATSIGLLVMAMGLGAGSVVTVELTTHPRQLTTTLTAIGLTVNHADVPDSPGGDDG